MIHHPRPPDYYGYVFSTLAIINIGLIWIIGSWSNV